MRVLFVSDTHLGFDLPSRPRVTRRRRGQDFFDNFERALAPAHAGEVDVVVHGGDLLYRSRVPPWLAEAALAPLRRVADRGIPVLLVLGNHERSRLPFPLFGLHEHLHVFDRPRTVVLEAGGVRVAFEGFPYLRQVRSHFREALAQARTGAPAADVRVLCLHQCVEYATCGPGDFMFRFGDEVVRADDLPREVSVTLAGHIHRHQIVHRRGRPPVVYAGSIERTSFAEAPEAKGFVVLQLTASRLGQVEFRPLPARPMVVLDVSLDGLDAAPACDRIAAAIATTPPDAVVQLRFEEPPPTGLTAAMLRALAGLRTVELARSALTRRSRHRRTRTSAGDDLFSDDPADAPAGSREPAV